GRFDTAGLPGAPPPSQHATPPDPRQPHNRDPTAIIQRYATEPIPGIKSFAIMKIRTFVRMLGQLRHHLAGRGAIGSGRGRPAYCPARTPRAAPPAASPARRSAAGAGR